MYMRALEGHAPLQCTHHVDDGTPVPGRRRCSAFSLLTTINIHAARLLWRDLDLLLSCCAAQLAPLDRPCWRTACGWPAAAMLDRCAWVLVKRAAAPQCAAARQQDRELLMRPAYARDVSSLWRPFLCMVWTMHLLANVCNIGTEFCPNIANRLTYRQVHRICLHSTQDELADELSLPPANLQVLPVAPPS